MRSRNIKPGFFLNEMLGELRPHTRLLFIGLWCYADKRGKFEWKPKKIRATIFPYEVFNIDAALEELVTAGFVIRYTVGNAEYGLIPNFEIHQKPHHNETESILPSPGDIEDSEAAPFAGWESLRRAVFKANGRICAFCGAKTSLIVDHIVAVCRGGRNELSNLQVLCRSCNKRKSVWEAEGISINDMKILAKSKKTCDLGNNRLLPRGKALVPDSLIPDSLIPDSQKIKNSSLHFSMESKEMELACLLRELINQRSDNGKAIPPKTNMQSWAKQIDRMMRLDSRTPREIEDVIRWCQKDEFWQNNILSTGKLRKQFVQLALKMKQSGGGKIYDTGRF